MVEKCKKIEGDIAIFICQPVHDILSIIIQLSVIFEYTEFNIIFIPGETYDIIDFLIENDLDSRFNLYNYDIDMIPIDNDLISLEKKDNFRRIFLDKDITPINDLANSIIKLEACFGKIKHKYIKGAKAKIFNDLLTKKEKEANLKTKEEIFGMIVFDRSIDFITPLTSNYTYEGLIDDNYGINKGNIIIDESYFKEKIDTNNNYSNKRMLYSLSSNANEFSEFFSKIRCMHYLDANNYLNEVRKYFTGKTKEDNALKNLETMQKYIEEINRFMALYRGPIIINTKLMSKIINENIKDDNRIYKEKEMMFLFGNMPKNMDVFYSDYMSDKKDLIQLLNLMCIESLTLGGIKNYYSLKKDILYIYGFQKVFLLRDLESMELLKDKASSKKSEISYIQLCNKLGLINQNFSKEKITDCSYIYYGYCPIILRLIEIALRGRWNKMKDTITKMPGETLFPKDESEILKQNKKIKTIFIVFIGGVSYTEIEGIRFLNLYLKQLYDTSKEGFNSRVQLIIVTDEILNKRKIFNSLGKTFEQKYSYRKSFQDMENSHKKKKK